MNETAKTRFSPSPTGLIHLGNTRTALFSYLLGLKLDGLFLLRIEDTDELRSKIEFIDNLQQDLQWLGYEWHEGPEKDLGRGPYSQSRRYSIYNEYYEKLIQQGDAYPCFCSDEQLAISRKIQLSMGKPPRYSGTCLHLTEAERQEKLQQGMKPALRFKVPKKQEILFEDFVKGPQRFLSDDIGDFIIRRADGSAAFFFCNAIDDALMQVTHVMRGEDHLTNTPRQLMILRALNLPKPSYGHIALITGPDGSPLSKRHGSRSVHELRQEGYLPEAINNYLARLGHYYENNQFMTLSELAEAFKFEHLSKSPARFDPDQLLHWQKLAVLSMSADAFWQWLGIEVHSAVPILQKEAFIDAIKGNALLPKDGLFWAERFFDEKLEYSQEALEIFTQASPAFFECLLTAVDKFATDYQKISAHLQTHLNVKGKKLFQPLRLALTNEDHGPELAKIFSLLGDELIIRRVKHIIKEI